MEVRDQLLRLVRLQALVLESRSAHALVENAPVRIEEIEERFRERNAEYVAVKQRFDALDEDQRTRSAELLELEEQHTKYKADLMQVQNQREYAAILREIDGIKSSIAEHEDAILKDMEEMESAKTDLATHEEHIKAERIAVATERAEVEATAGSARSDIARLTEERQELQTDLPRQLVSAVKRLEDGRQGQFLSGAEEGVCQSCFVRVRPQVFQEIKLSARIHYCSNCKRVLIHEPSLEKNSAEGGEAAPGAQKTSPGKVEAINGGAV